MYQCIPLRSQYIIIIYWYHQLTMIFRIFPWWTGWRIFFKTLDGPNKHGAGIAGIAALEDNEDRQGPKVCSFACSNCCAIWRMGYRSGRKMLQLNVYWSLGTKGPQPVEVVERYIFRNGSFHLRAVFWTTIFLSSIVGLWLQSRVSMDLQGWSCSVKSSVFQRFSL